MLKRPLPPYSIPTAKAIGRHTWEKGRQYLEKMATTILIFSVALWALGYFPHHEGATDAYQLEHSYVGTIGKAIEPAMAPMGFNWKMDVGLLAGIGAKELVISSLGVTYAQEGEEELTTEEDSEETALQRALTASIPTAAALAFMVFVLLYFPCIATVVAINNDTGKWRWTILLCRHTILVAWICSFAAYRIGLLIW